MSEINKSTAITSVLREIRVFKPRKEFAEKAHIKSLAHWRKLYNESVKTPDKFWAKQAKSELVWFKPWKKVLDWKEPFAKWFAGGRLNVSDNCLDKWLGTPTATTLSALAKCGADSARATIIAVCDCACRWHQCCQLMTTRNSAHSRFKGSSWTS